jgi:molecular chaperone DnaJ
MMATQRDYYEVLGVKKDASADEIKKAYKKAALANHPDRNPGDSAAEERFKEAAEAFEVLSDDDKRAAYDRYGHAGVKGRGHAGTGFHDVEEIFGTFGDLFEGLFGGGFGGRRGQRVSCGANLRCEIRLTLREAAKGVSREIEIDRAELCAKCDGSGAKPGSKPERCNYCGGRGQVVQSQGFFRLQTTCPACRGEGAIVREKCPACRGSGREVKRAKLDVKVPPGLDNGMQLCLRGKGEPGHHGGPRGDLFCEIRVQNDPFFKRDGANLGCVVPITFTQAALGTDFEIPLLEGRHKLVIPPGTQPGEVFRLRGRGMPDPHGRGVGDLLVEVQIEVPRKLTEQQEELLRQLAEVENANVSPHQKSFFEMLKDYFSPSGPPENVT